jgi:hypothetical protein
MELVNQSDYYCNQCEKHATECGNNFIKFNDNLNKTKNKLHVCADCLIEAVLMIRPIEFDKDFIKLFLETLQENDKGLFSSVGKFSVWLKPFLEGK